MGLSVIGKGVARSILGIKKEEKWGRPQRIRLADHMENKHYPLDFDSHICLKIKKKAPHNKVKGLEEGGDLLSHLVWQYHRRGRA